jgi:hypothetical protein
MLAGLTDADTAVQAPGLALFGWLVPMLGYPRAELQKVLDTIERVEIQVTAHPLRKIRTHLHSTLKWVWPVRQSGCFACASATAVS